MLLSHSVNQSALEVDKTAIEMVLDVAAILTVEVCSRLLEHNAEEDSEEGWCLDTTLLLTIVVGEWF